jgi:hypothetical protein
MMIILKLAMTVALVHFVSLCAFPQGGKAAVVRGRVTDVTGAVIPNVIVTFVDGNRTFAVKTSQTGEYSTMLTPGVYKVSADALASGFQTLRRSDIRVLENSSRSLNFELSGPFLVLEPPPSTMSNLADHGPSGYLPYQYEEISNVSRTGLGHALVAFGTKCDTPSAVVYKAEPFDQAAGAKVTLTYDFYTIMATKLVFDKRNKGSFVASGKVVFEDGQRRQLLGDTVSFTHEDGKIIIATPMK